MELTRALVAEKAREYRDAEPFDAVERDHVEIIPETFSSGDFGWRDAEWVVQWYYRRYRGAYPDERRRANEDAFRENDFDDVVDVLTHVSREGDVHEKTARLTTLEGVAVPVASAFLQFVFPDRYVVVGDREWSVLENAGELEGPYPDPPSVEEYVTYHEACRDLVDRLEVDPWTLYRAIWRLSSSETGE